MATYEAMKLLRSQYFAVCEEADAQLGRMFDALRGTNEWNNTMVIFTTDHGEVRRQPSVQITPVQPLPIQTARPVLP